MLCGPTGNAIEGSIPHIRGSAKDEGTRQFR
jgi:hypothetical protein